MHVHFIAHVSTHLFACKKNGQEHSVSFPCNILHSEFILVFIPSWLPPNMFSSTDFFSYIFLGFFVYMDYLCLPSEASTRYCVIPGGYPPQDWQNLPCAGEELDSNPGLLICSQVCYHWATSPPSIETPLLLIEPPLLLLSHLSSLKSHLSTNRLPTLLASVQSTCWRDSSILRFLACWLP